MKWRREEEEEREGAYYRAGMLTLPSADNAAEAYHPLSTGHRVSQTTPKVS